MQCHSDAVSCLLVAGGTLFSASHDFAIVAQEEPVRRGDVPASAAASRRRWLCKFESARVVRHGAVLCMAANENQLISGDAVGAALVQAPRKYSTAADRPKPSSSLDPSETVLESRASSSSRT